MSTLPSRYRQTSGVLDAFSERVAILQQTTSQRQAHLRPATILGSSLAVAAVIIAVAALDVRADRPTGAGRAPYDGPGLVSAAGITPTPRDFTPEGERPPATAAVAGERTPREELREITTPPSPPPTPTTTARAARPFDVLVQPPRPTPIPAPAEAPRPLPEPSPSPSPRPTLNLGTRIPVRILGNATTALNGAPVSATVAGDVVRDGRVLVPAGTVVHGDAYATPESDSRAQLTWSAMVLTGQTVRLTASTLGADDQLGVPGKLVRKASKTKRGFGTVLGAVGRAVTFGAFGSGGVAQRAAGETVARVGDGLDGLGREWTVSDKGVRVAAGTSATLVLRADVELP